MDDICKSMTVEEIIQLAEEVKKEQGDDVRIVIAQRGWVFVGRYTATAEEVVLHKAHCIRVWGTKKGLGELINGPLDGTKLDDSGTVRMHPLAVLATMDCNVDKWDGVL